MEEKKKEVKGTIANINYRNSDNWAVFSVLNDNAGYVSCTGILPEICDHGSEVTCTGSFIQGKYGLQLKCSQILPAPPDINSDAGVIKLLQRLPSLGLVKSRQAVLKYGAKDAWNRAINDPHSLGIPEKHCMEAANIANELIGSSETIIYLLGIGLTNLQVKKINDHYNSGSISVVSENPYLLIGKIDGFGFLTVDRIALKAGISVGNSARISACVEYCLTSNQVNEGHIYHWGKELVKIVLSQLTESAKKNTVSLIGAPDYEQVRQCIYNLASENKVVIEKGKVYSKTLLDAEKTIEVAL